MTTGAIYRCWFDTGSSSGSSRPGCKISGVYSGSTHYLGGFYLLFIIQKPVLLLMVPPLVNPLPVFILLGLFLTGSFLKVVISNSAFFVKASPSLSVFTISRSGSFAAWSSIPGRDGLQRSRCRGHAHGKFYLSNSDFVHESYALFQSLETG